MEVMNPADIAAAIMARARQVQPSEPEIDIQSERPKGRGLYERDANWREHNREMQRKAWERRRLHMPAKFGRPKRSEATA